MTQVYRGARGIGAQSRHERLACGLGWFSIALGAAELLAPDRVRRGAGLRSGAAPLRGYGLREIATGIAILRSHDPTPWVWGRVLGDALDIATVAAAPREPGRRGRRCGALLALLAVGLVDLCCACGLSREKRLASDGGADYSDRSGLPGQS